MRVSQPVGQKRHTNIAVVSVRKKIEGKEYKFEIACYPNKVLNQREGLEDDLSQVLQTETVFTNVSRGDIATNEDLITAFGTTNHLKVCKEIIKEGNLQVSTKEREYITESLHRDVVSMLTQMTMDATTGFPLTATQIQAALDDINYHISAKGALRGSRTTKYRDEEDEMKMIARDCVKRLETELPHRVARVSMLIKVIAREAGIISHEDIERLAEGRCIVNEENSFTFLITCHPSLMKIIKDTYGDEIQSISVVDSSVHTNLPNPIAAKVISEANPAPVIEEVLPVKHQTQPTPPPGSHCCATCGNISFESVSQFRTHCKSEWHSFNKKREVKKLPPLDHFDFELLGEDLRIAFNAVDP